jgi:hypothetical protein
MLSQSDPACPRDTADSRFVFSMNETRPRFTFLFFPVDHSLDAHLVDLLSARRRCSDGFATKAAPAKKKRPAGRLRWRDRVLFWDGNLVAKQSAHHAAEESAGATTAAIVAAAATGGQCIELTQPGETAIITSTGGKITIHKTSTRPWTFASSCAAAAGLCSVTDLADATPAITPPVQDGSDPTGMLCGR